MFGMFCVWPGRNSTIKPREVNGFGEEFSDGLVFAVLLLAYVPFLVSRAYLVHLTSYVAKL